MSVPSLTRPFLPARALRVVPVAGAALAALLVAGCATAPYSYLYDRQVYYRAVLHRYPVTIVSVDGAGAAFHPEPITPGEHFVTLDAQPTAGFALPVEKTYTLTIAPCTRYYIAAQRESPVQQDWNLVVEQTWAVSGCDPQKEIAKAREAVAKGEQPPVSSFLEPAAPMRMDAVVRSDATVLPATR